MITVCFTYLKADKTVDSSTIEFVNNRNSLIVN